MKIYLFQINVYAVYGSGGQKQLMSFQQRLKNNTSLSWWIQLTNMLCLNLLPRLKRGRERNASVNDVNSTHNYSWEYDLTSPTIERIEIFNSDWYSFSIKIPYYETIFRCTRKVQTFNAIICDKIFDNYISSQMEQLKTLFLIFHIARCT